MRLNKSFFNRRSSRERQKNPIQLIGTDSDTDDYDNDNNDEKKKSMSDANIDNLPKVEFSFEKAKKMFDMLQNTDIGLNDQKDSLVETSQHIPENKDYRLSMSNFQDDTDVSHLLAKVKELQIKKYKTIDDYFPEIKEKKKKIHPCLTFA